jgi:hypothetical protein
MLGILTSCFPEFDAKLSDLDIAISREDKNQDFTQLNSFFLYDTINYIDNNEKPTPKVQHQFDDQILDLVKQNLKGIGWTEISQPSESNIPDVSIFISVLNVDLSYYYYNWTDYWYWYPWQWWYPGWNYPVYPVFPPGYSPIYSFSVGTIMIDMVNMNELLINPLIEPPISKIPIVWTGAVNGILAGSDEYISGRLTAQINQVFTQSSYLFKKQPK